MLFFPVRTPLLEENVWKIKDILSYRTFVLYPPWLLLNFSSIIEFSQMEILAALKYLAASILYSLWCALVKKLVTIRKPITLINYIFSCFILLWKHRKLSHWNTNTTYFHIFLHIHYNLLKRFLMDTVNNYIMDCVPNLSYKQQLDSILLSFEVLGL